MATKKPSSKPSKPKTSPRKLQNLAARPPAFDDDVPDDQLVDASGVFRVTSAITQAQTGHDEDDKPRFASESLVMAAQRDNFREDGHTLDDAVEQAGHDDDVVRAERRSRLATLASRARQTRASRTRR
jgi:hypothetical protein